MSLIKKLASETVYYGISSILSRLLNYVIVTPYLTWTFARGEYGVVSEMYSYIAILSVLFTYRMETAYFRYASDKAQRASVFSTSALTILASTTFLTGLLLLFSEPIAAGLGYPNNADYVQWFVLILAADALSAIPFASLRLANRPLFFAFAKTIGIVVNILFLFFFLEGCPWLIAHGHGWAAHIYDGSNRIAYIFIANLMGSLATLLLLLREYRNMSRTFDTALLRKMLIYVAPLVVVGLAAVVNQLASIPLLKYLLPYSVEENTAQMGVFGACQKIAILMSLFTQAFNYAAEPFFFRNASRSDSKTVFAQVGQAFALVGSTVFLGIMLYLGLLQHFIGPQFREGLTVVPILLMAFVFLGLYYNFSIWYKLSDRTDFGAYISVGGTAITLGLNFWLIPRIGYMGAAWTTFACYGFMAMASYLGGQWYFPVPYPIGKMAAYMLGALAVYGISLWAAPWLGEGVLLYLFNTLLFVAYLLICFVSSAREDLFRNAVQG
jgi:O-antigen/teichoic acid export membrane protein